jgi:endonuclease III related protein
MSGRPPRSRASIPNGASAVPSPRGEGQGEGKRGVRSTPRQPGVHLATTTHALRRAYELMRARHGHQRWWPGDTPFEVCVGAILTQNKSWKNVERAIANLKHACALEPRQLLALPESNLATLLRPAGYFNLKARRLRAFVAVLVRDFDADLARLFAGPTATVRERLLAIHGIGPETADSMLLYAGGHGSFVIDAYTKRIFQRHGWMGRSAMPKVQGAMKGSTAKGNTREEYESLKALCESALHHLPASQRLDYWQDYHAQLVVIGKDYCRPREARCDECPLQPLLPKASRMT